MTGGVTLDTSNVNDLVAMIRDTDDERQRDHGYRLLLGHFEKAVNSWIRHYGHGLDYDDCHSSNDHTKGTAKLTAARRNITGRSRDRTARRQAQRFQSDLPNTKIQSGIENGCIVGFNWQTSRNRLGKPYFQLADFCQFKGGYASWLCQLKNQDNTNNSRRICI
jgi:hypothetical protein